MIDGPAPRPVVELRVHGVSGTPPEELLDRTLIRQVAGDGVAGFSRPRPPDDALDEPVPDDGAGPRTQAYLEAYAWGGLTSGAPIRALWLLLLPFALLNVAPRLRPAALDPARLAAVLLLARVLAVLSTVTLVLGTAAIGVDLLGWQCGAGRPCAGLPAAVLGWLAARPAGVRVLLGAVPAVALLLVLWWLSRATVERYESVPDGRAPSDELDPAADEPDPRLHHRWMWRGTHMVGRLRRLHLHAGVLAIVLVAALALDTTAAVVAPAVLGCATIVAALARRDVTGRRPGTRLTGASRALLALCSASTACAALLTVALLAAGRVRAGGTGLPGLDALVTVGFAVQAVAVAALVVVVAPVRDPAAGLRGLGTPLLAAAGVLLGAVFTAGMYIYAADWLRTGNAVSSLASIAASVEVVDVPWALRFASACFAGAVIVLALLALAALARFRWGWHAGSTADAVFQAYPQVVHGVERDDRIRRIFWQAGTIDRLDRSLAVVLAGTAVLAGVATVVALVHLATGVAWLDSRGARSWTAVGSYLASGLLVLLVALGVAVYRVPATRRSVGIVWDLASFWPRAVHPLAPPCYAERTVPDLKARIRWHAAGAECSDLPRGAVVLAAHSQGTVISAAALIQMADRPADADVRARVAFLSYGCVLRRLYSRYFPTYFDVPTLAGLARTLEPPGGRPRWTNLWRRSDYLGGPMGPGLAALDVELTDPVYDRQPGDLGYPSPGRHSGYPRDPEFQRQVAELAELLPVSTSVLDPACAPRTVM